MWDASASGILLAAVGCLQMSVLSGFPFFSVPAVPGGIHYPRSGFGQGREGQLGVDFQDGIYP